MSEQRTEYTTTAGDNVDVRVTQQADDFEFWLSLRGQLLAAVDAIERHKLKLKTTTAQLRHAGKSTY